MNGCNKETVVLSHDMAQKNKNSRGKNTTKLIYVSTRFDYASVRAKFPCSVYASCTAIVCYFLAAVVEMEAVQKHGQLFSPHLTPPRTHPPTGIERKGWEERGGEGRDRGVV